MDQPPECFLTVRNANTNLEEFFTLVYNDEFKLGRDRRLRYYIRDEYTTIPKDHICTIKPFGVGDDSISVQFKIKKHVLDGKVVKFNEVFSWQDCELVLTKEHPEKTTNINIPTISTSSSNSSEKNVEKPLKKEVQKEVLAATTKIISTNKRQKHHENFEEALELENHRKKKMIEEKTNNKGKNSKRVNDDEYVQFYEKIITYFINN